MQLLPEETDLFFKLWFSLLSYVSRRHPELVGMAQTPDEIRLLPVALLYSLRKPLYEHPDLIDAFATANPHGFTDAELGIVREWRHFVKGEFVVLRLLKSHAIFLTVSGPPKAYGVLALNSSFDSMFPIPALVETTLLPFNGRITYDGLFNYKSLLFGPGIRASMSDDYERAKSLHGVITSLPFKPSNPQQSNSDLLRFYLKNERNREEHWGDINDLLKEGPSLHPLFHQETGKRHARAFKRRLKDWSIGPGWFAMLDDLVLASGTNSQEVTDAFKRLVPAENWDYIYVFQWKP